MALLFLGLCFLVVVFWGYGLPSLLRLSIYQKNHSGGSVITGVVAISRNPSHPLHDDAKKVLHAYSGFLLCILGGFLVMHFGYHKI